MSLQIPTENVPAAWAKLMEVARDAIAERDRLKAVNEELVEAVEGVLIASEDGGGMNDIDWEQLRKALAAAK